MSADATTARLWTVATVFGGSSLMAIGGANTIVPHLREQIVERHDWIADRMFAYCYAIAQVVPGPNTLLSTLLGYRIAGLRGPPVATAAMTVPATLLAFTVCTLWLRTGHARWHTALGHGLSPISVGLVASAATVLASAIDRSLGGCAVTAAALTLLLSTRVHPLLVVFAGGVAGLALHL